jgi:hypothetical protein
MCHQKLMTAIITRRWCMKQIRSWVMGALCAAVLSFASMPFNPHAAEAQTDAAGVAGAYAEEVAADASAEIFTAFILHADGTFTLIDSSDTQQLVFVGAWRQADALTVEGTVIGADIPLPSDPGGGMTGPPSLEVSERDYMVVFQDNTYETATVTSTRGTVDSFTAQRVAAPMQTAPTPTPTPAPTPAPAPPAQ